MPANGLEPSSADDEFTDHPRLLMARDLASHRIGSGSGDGEGSPNRLPWACVEVDICLVHLDLVLDCALVLEDQGERTTSLDLENCRFKALDTGSHSMLVYTCDPDEIALGFGATVSAS